MEILQFSNIFQNFATTTEIMIALILFTIVAIILYYCMNFVKEFIWDIFTVSVVFSTTHNCENRDNYKQVYEFIAKLTTLTQEKPRDRLFGFWSHVKPIIQLKQLLNGKYYTKVKSGPKYGTSFFIYKGHWVRVIRTPTPDITSKGTTCERIQLSTFKWHAEILKSLIVDAVEPRYVEKTDKPVLTTNVYTTNNDRWVQLGYSKPIRKLDSVFLAKGQAETLLEDIQDFLESKEWCEIRCIPHHRGYLLHGPAGCGKTSLIRAAAGYLKYDICSLSLSSEGLTDDRLVRYLNSTPYKTIILIEDVDCAFKSRGDATASTAETNVVMAGNSRSSVTFRGFLNALDGVATCDGKIVFMTTNHPEKLDPALTRPGRVDYKVLVDYPDLEQLGRFFSRFYPDASEEVKSQFLCEMKKYKKVSMAMVQGLFMSYKKSADGVVQGCKDYFRDQFGIVPSI